MSEDEYMQTFDASILTKQDISDLSYLQTYGRMQGICMGHDDVIVSSFNYENAMKFVNLTLFQQYKTLCLGTV